MTTSGPAATAPLAVLIDADNAQAALAPALFAEVAKHGVAHVRRAYGDWTTPQLSGWKAVLSAHAIQPIQQFANTRGKNATDSALIIDAMDLLHTDRYERFCLVSSDSDFTRLATRLRESGKEVLGVGERKTPPAFVAACNRFVYTEVLTVGDELIAPERERDFRPDQALLQRLSAAVGSASDESGWAHLGSVGQHLSKQSPDFDVRTWGFTKLSQLLRATGRFDVQERQWGANQSPAMCARARSASR